MEPVGLYLHIPFCVKKCAYCDFYSQPLCGEELPDAYLEALQSSMAAYRAEYGAFPIDTVYFGGGTPSLFREKRLRILLEEAARFALAKDAEITLEANPDTVDKSFLKACWQTGFTRISFGIQSAIEKELEALGRIHSFARARQAIEWSLEAGFTHVSGDVMVGIPYQTLPSLEETLQKVGTLGVDHLSAYLLKLEEGTALAQNRDRYPMMDEDELGGAYLSMVKILSQLGFSQYEISNFAKEGGQSRHNLKYWECKPYLGLGPGAHSNFDGRRFSYPKDLAGFLACAKTAPFAVETEDHDPATEQVMLGLRLSRGLSYAEAAACFGKAEGALLTACEPLRKAGLIFPDKERLKLTPEGFLVSNGVIGFVLEALES